MYNSNYRIVSVFYKSYIICQLTKQGEFLAVATESVFILFVVPFPFFHCPISAISTDIIQYL